MFRCKWSDSIVLRELIDGISDLVDTASFYADEKNLRIEASDPSVICKIEIEAKRAGDNVSINVEKEYLEFTIHNFVERYFRIPLLEFGEPLPQINIDASVFLRIRGSVFVDLVKDIAVIGSSLIIKANPEEITFFAEEDGVKTSANVSKTNDAIEMFKVDNECTSKFNLSYILSFLKTATSVDYIDISFGNKDTPLKIEYSSDKATIRFYLAPMEI